MAVTLKDISRETGINLCSVSQVLNDHPRAQSLRPETRQRILETAARLGYSKNQMAAAIGKKHSNVLAFVHSDMGSVEYTGRIQNGVFEAANECGYTLIVHHIGESPELLLRKLTGWRVAGVIFHVSRLSQIEPFAELLEKEHIPYGTVNLSNPGGIGITTDDASGIREAVHYLKESGHKNLAYLLTGKKNSIPDIEYKIRRIQGFEQGMKENFPSVRKPFVLPVDFTKAHDHEYMGGVLETLLKKKMDAVICESDVLAAALNNIAFYKGYRIPEQFSLVGFGGSLVAESSFPMLSTVVQDFEGMGRNITNCIVNAVEKKKKALPNVQLLPVSLLIRESALDRLKSKKT